MSSWSFSSPMPFPINVKPMAKTLITHFGSFGQVLDAPLEAFLEVRAQDSRGRNTPRLTEG